MDISRKTLNFELLIDAMEESHNGIAAVLKTAEGNLVGVRVPLPPPEDGERLCGNTKPFLFFSLSSRNIPDKTRYLHDYDNIHLN